jgi:hypothetical protein
MKEEKTYPLVLVFYLDREMMSNPEITKPFADSVNQMIIEKNFNVMAFFLPTDGEERVDCINPMFATEEQKENIDQLINDIKKTFDIDNEK